MFLERRKETVLPNGWSPLSRKSKDQYSLEYLGPHVFYSHEGWHLIENLRTEAQKLTIDVLNPDLVNKDTKPICLPIFYQGLGDWIRSVRSLKSISSMTDASIFIFCLDFPIARDFIETQLLNDVCGVIWIPTNQPFYFNEPQSKLDWCHSPSHIAWNEILNDLIEKVESFITKDAIILRNPNHKLPPYTDEFIPDYRVAIFQSENQIFEYKIDHQSNEWAEQWWENKLNCDVIGICLRTDTNLLSSHRLTDSDTINQIIRYILENFPKYKILFFGNKLPAGIDVKFSDSILDFTEPWNFGISINKQAAVLKRLKGVIGFNSGGVDLPTACGVPTLRLRSHLPPSQFLNDNLGSSFSVNLDKEFMCQEGVGWALEYFFEQINNQTKTGKVTAYLSKDFKIIKNSSINIPPIENYFREEATSDCFDIIQECGVDDLFIRILNCFQRGIIPIVIGDLSCGELFKSSFGLKYLEDIQTGFILSKQSDADQLIQRMILDPNHMRLVIHTNYIKYQAIKSQSNFHKCQMGQ